MQHAKREISSCNSHHKVLFSYARRLESVDEINECKQVMVRKVWKGKQILQTKEVFHRN